MDSADAGCSGKHASDFDACSGGPAAARRPAP